VLVNSWFEVTYTEPGLMTALIIAQAHEEEPGPTRSRRPAPGRDALRPLEDSCAAPSPTAGAAIRLTTAP